MLNPYKPQLSGKIENGKVVRQCCDSNLLLLLDSPLCNANDHPHYLLISIFEHSIPVNYDNSP